MENVCRFTTFWELKFIKVPFLKVGPFRFHPKNLVLLDGFEFFDSIRRALVVFLFVCLFVCLLVGWLVGLLVSLFLCLFVCLFLAVGGRRVVDGGWWVVVAVLVVIKMLVTKMEVIKVTRMRMVMSGDDVDDHD